MTLEEFKNKCREKQIIVEEEELKLEKRRSKLRNLISEQEELGKGYRPKLSLILKRLFIGYVCPICSIPLQEEVIIKRTLGVEGESIYRCRFCKYEYAMLK